MSATELALTNIADVNGAATITITPYRRQVWTVSQVSVEAVTTSTTAMATVRKGDFLITPLVAQADAAAGDPPVILRPGETLSVSWANLNAGDQVRAIILYDDGV